jgi:hypothetical protein
MILRRHRPLWAAESWQSCGAQPRRRSPPPALPLRDCFRRCVTANLPPRPGCDPGRGVFAVEAKPLPNTGGPLGMHKPIRSRSTPWWGRLRERLLGPQPREGREPPLEQRSVEQPGYSGASRLHSTTGHLLRLSRPRLPSVRISVLQISSVRVSPLPTAGLWISRLIGCSRFPRSLGLWIPSSGYPAYSGAPGYKFTNRLWRSRITSVFPAMNGEPNWDIRLTLILPAMETRGTWEKPASPSPGYEYRSPPSCPPHSLPGDRFSEI